MTTAVIPSQFGNIKIEEEDNKITSIQFTKDDLCEPENKLLKLAAREIVEYLSGSRKSFEFEIHPSGTEFQINVWNELQRIPYGKTISYQELANRLGDPLCIRAAATANGKNPLAIVIPCHRVIGSDGSMTGYAGGIENKKGLLTLEGAAVMNQMNIF